MRRTATFLSRVRLHCRVKELVKQRLSSRGDCCCLSRVIALRILDKITIDSPRPSANAYARNTTANFSCVEKLRLRFACCTCKGLCANTQFRGCCATAGTIEFVYAKWCTHAKRKRNFSTQTKSTVVLLISAPFEHCVLREYSRKLSRRYRNLTQSEHANFASKSERA